MEHSWDGIERRVMNLVAQHPAEADAPRVGVDADGLSAHVAIHNIQFDTSGFDLKSNAGLSSGPRLTPPEVRAIIRQGV